MVELTNEQMERLEGVATKHGVDLIVLFGSMVSGKTHPRSDVDLGVRLEGGREVTWQALGDLDADLEEVFPGREVDLGLINRADPLFLWQIVQKGQLLVGDPRAYADLKMLAYKRYVDHRRFLDMEAQYVRSRLSA